MLTRSLPELQTHHVKYAEYTLRPDISIYQALRGRFILDQVTYTIGGCPNDVFKRFIIVCSQAAHSKQWRPKHQKTLLRMLDGDCSEVTRWYAIETLLAHRVSVPLSFCDSSLRTTNNQQGSDRKGI